MLEGTTEAGWLGRTAAFGAPGGSFGMVNASCCRVADALFPTGPRVIA
jgi:hypothetical protein